MASIRKGNVRRKRGEFRRTHPLRPWIMVPNGFEPRPATVGEAVKLGFRDAQDAAEGFGQTEWMWAEIVSEQDGVYTGVMRNTGAFCDVRAGMKVTFTAENVLTTYDNCPMRAMADLEPLGGTGGQRLDALRAYEAKTGLGRREAVAAMLADLPKAA